ncbi:hypothetical protein I79_014698 [Cricetulus griseus]|uniref:Uncharacterized protein n=1 Tax=Cricetulus griseus TaxID=10029 RepID=G3HUT2_CRIGR|nr:hypothetical protein I79_014698 [Cricetulus griseus]
MGQSAEHGFLLQQLSDVFLTQVSNSHQTVGYCHSCCHHCCHSSHCCPRCYSTLSCDDGDEEICEACGGSGSSHHSQSCSSLLS